MNSYTSDSNRSDQVRSCQVTWLDLLKNPCSRGCIGGNRLVHRLPFQDLPLQMKQYYIKKKKKKLRTKKINTNPSNHCASVPFSHPH